MKIGRIVGTLIYGILIFIPSVALAQEPDTTQGTSPLTNTETISVDTGTVSVQDSNKITFSEYPVNTYITDQYDGQGIIFDGDTPFISRDNANPTSPVLSGSPRFRGAIEGMFVNPANGITPMVVESFNLDAGYFNEFGSTRIEWFDPLGFKLGQRANTKFGIEKFEIKGGNIASWRISILLTEPAGYAIDNVSFEPAGSTVVFRENKEDGRKAWLEDVPGFDHIGLQVDDLVYESHPGYVDGYYTNELNGTETKFIAEIDGVQGQHSKGTFAYDNGKQVKFEEIPIDQMLAEDMRDLINTQLNVGYPQELVHREHLSWKEILQKLAPAVQKNLAGNGTFTCVGLIEWAAEEAGHNFGQGFILDVFESIGPVPLLSPQLMNYSMKFVQVLDDVDEWFQGLFDPVDFMITDPLGRRLGYTAALGEVNEIPFAFFSGDGEIEQFLIPYPVPGEYQVILTGLDAQVNGALGSSKTSSNVDTYLVQGEVMTTTARVFMYVGSPGDVNEDGCIDTLDVMAMSPLLNTFTNTPKHPADIDGDGLINQADVVLLNQLVQRNLCVRNLYMPIIVK